MIVENAGIFPVNEGLLVKTVDIDPAMLEEKSVCGKILGEASSRRGRVVVEVHVGASVVLCFLGSNLSQTSRSLA